MIIDSSEQRDEGDDANRIMLQALMSCMTSYSLSLSQNSVCVGHYTLFSFLSFFHMFFIFLFLFPSHHNPHSISVHIVFFYSTCLSKFLFCFIQFSLQKLRFNVFPDVIIFFFFLFFILNQMMILSFIHHTLYNVNSQYLIQFIIHFISSLQTSFDVSSSSDFFFPHVLQNINMFSCFIFSITFSSFIIS